MRCSWMKFLFQQRSGFSTLKSRRGSICFRNAALVLLILLSHPGPGFGLSSVNVPLDSWVYPALEKLSAMGYINNAIWGMKPFSRIEVGRLLVEAKSGQESSEGDEEVHAFAKGLLERLLEEFERETRYIEFSQNELLKSRLKPLGEPRIRYGFVERRPRNLSVFSPKGARLYATEGTPLWVGEEGVVLDGKNNLILDFGAQANLFGLFSFYYHPVLLANFETFSGEGDEVSFLNHSGHAKFNIGRLEIMAGRESLKWGQGDHGTLVLSGNAPPLDMIQISSSSPFKLPWYFGYLGLIKASLFLTEMEDSRVIGHPLFLGMRVCIRPHPVIEIGAARTIMFGGKGVPHVSVGDFFQILGGENLEGGEDNSNHLAGVDIRLTIPFLRNTELYGELYGEDEAGGLPSRNSLLAGLYIPRITAGGRLDLRVEVVRTHLQYAIHHLYQSGYTYNGLLLGHPAGPNTLSIFGRTTFYLFKDIRLGFDFEYEERKPCRDEPGVDETIFRQRIDFQYAPSWWMDLSAGLGFERAENFEHTQGDVRNNWIAHISYRFRF